MKLFSISKTKQQAIKLTLLTAFLGGCATTNNFAVDTIYRKEVNMQVDGLKTQGIYVAGKKPSYKLRFELPDKPNVVKITTCHREETFRDVGKSLEYEYKPVLGLEDTGSCMLEMGAFDETGANLWGLIDFEDTEKMPAWVGCNGLAYTSRGASICQSKSGLIQSMTFARAVTAYSKESCPKMESKDNLVFTYVMAADKCIYLFSDGIEEHRHTTFGYDEVLIK